MSIASTSQDKQSRVNAIPFWWHSIDLGDGVVTPGHKTPERLKKELNHYHIPNLSGRTVLDIGAWDGFFSFHAEKLGARRVVALDHYAWSVDWSARTAKDRRLPRKQAALHTPDQDTERWRPEELPGQRGFNLAHELLDSSVEPVVADFMETDLNTLGQFDVVFFLGVLYHMRHPLLSLERLAQLTREVAVIETAAVWAHPNRAWCEFFETNELGNDPSNWWAPNEKALIGMCRAAGFRRVEIMHRPSLWKRTASSMRPRHYRLSAHAYK